MTEINACSTFLYMIWCYINAFISNEQVDSLLSVSGLDSQLNWFINWLYLLDKDHFTIIVDWLLWSQSEDYFKILTYCWAGYDYQNNRQCDRQGELRWTFHNSNFAAFILFGISLLLLTNTAYTIITTYFFQLYANILIQPRL